MAALLTSLQFNNYFQGLVIKNLKFEKDQFMSLANLVQVNKFLEVLELPGVIQNVQVTFPTGNPFVNLSEALGANAGMSLKSLNLSNNPVEEKGKSAMLYNAYYCY
jgi:hypothetical protein